jgi:hypothetical protein
MVWTTAWILYGSDRTDMDRSNVDRGLDGHVDKDNMHMGLVAVTKGL